MKFYKTFEGSSYLSTIIKHSDTNYGIHFRSYDYKLWGLYRQSNFNIKCSNFKSKKDANDFIIKCNNTYFECIHHYNYDTNKIN